MKFTHIFVFLLACTFVCKCEEETSQEVIPPQPEVFSQEFKASTARLLDIIVHSLYSNRDIFLRELISNSIDALEKVRFLSLTNPSMLGEGDEAILEVRVIPDIENGLLIIEDSGIGMTHDELINNLGTIAESGTRRFREAAMGGEETEDGAETPQHDTSNLIGQFGVGFFSAYLVADWVTFDTKRTDSEEEAWRWESDAHSTYQITECPTPMHRGSRLTLHLRDDALEYLEEEGLQELIAQYASFMPFPVKLRVSEQVPVAVEEVEEEEEEEDFDSDFDFEDFDESDEIDEDVEPLMETVYSWEVINSAPPLWLREPSDISDDEYRQFYRDVIARGKKEDPAGWVHFRGEGDHAFRALVYIPAEAPHDFYTNFQDNSQSALQLYINRVFVTDDIKGFLPPYMGFLAGVVDSDSIPINLSREMLQTSKAVSVIGKRITKRVLRELAAMKKDAMMTDEFSILDTDDEDEDEEEEEYVEDEEIALDTRYFQFYSAYGRSLKIGALEDGKNQKKLLDLLMFFSSELEQEPGFLDSVKEQPSPEQVAKLSTLDQYVERMPDYQEDIYTVAGLSLEEARRSPALESAVASGLEVLYLAEPLDEFIFSKHTTFTDSEGVEHKVLSLQKDDVELPKPESEDDEDEDEEEENVSNYSQELLFAWLKHTIKVNKVTASSKLTSTPAVISAGAYGPSAVQQRIMRAQAAADDRSVFTGMRTLELNMGHPDIVRMADVLESANPRTLGSDEVPAAEDIDAPAGLVVLAEVLRDTALLAGGYELESFTDYSSRLVSLLSEALHNADRYPVTPEDERWVEPEPELEVEEPEVFEDVIEEADAEEEADFEEEDYEVYEEADFVVEKDEL
eukprot:gnl/Dysnectes_brevis/753_a827_3717.p1 GENE.gnl/Dysnectes_brevis/753_a827_3717~~gnl/Dysnectes_brevis/753_a827_3717.p1  ORF type:complete len:855 (-),score=371.77 gnl/Dysnectes_brevis/753_a827_3717:31-2595(-)